MQQPFGIVKRLRIKNEYGAAAIEYGMLAALVGVALFVGAKLMGTSLNGLFDSVGAFLSNVGIEQAN